MQAFHGLLVLDTRRNQVDSCGFDVGVAQYIRQLRDVLACLIEAAGEQMPQIVGKRF